MKTATEIEAIYKSQIGVSVQAALLAVYEAGVADGRVPQPVSGGFVPFAPIQKTDPLAALRDQLKGQSPSRR